MPFPLPIGVFEKILEAAGQLLRTGSTHGDEVAIEFYPYQDPPQYVIAGVRPLRSDAELLAINHLKTIAWSQGGHPSGRAFWHGTQIFGFSATGDAAVEPPPASGGSPIPPAPPAFGGGAMVPALPGGSAVGTALSAIASKLPQAVIRIIQTVGGKWGAMPGWVQQILVVLGVTEGTDIILDVVDGGAGSNLPALPTGNPMQTFADGALMDPQHGLIVKQWRAPREGGTYFVKFADGWQAAWSPTRQAWKYWKPRKPIVMYSDGARTPQEAQRAFNALKKQAKKLKPMVDQFSAPKRTRRPVQEHHNPDGSITIIKG